MLKIVPRSELDPKSLDPVDDKTRAIVDSILNDVLTKKTKAFVDISVKLGDMKAASDSYLIRPAGK